MPITPHTRELLECFGLIEDDLEHNRHGRLSDAQFENRIARFQFAHNFFLWCTRICGTVLFASLIWGTLRGWHALEPVGVFLLLLVFCLCISAPLSIKTKNHLDSERRERTAVHSLDAKVNITRSQPAGTSSYFKVTTTDGRVLKAGPAVAVLQTGIMYRFYEYKGEVVSAEALEEPRTKKDN